MAKKVKDVAKDVVKDAVEAVANASIELRTDFSHYAHRAPQAEVLYDRFHKVILAAGYDAAAAVGILHREFDMCMTDMHAFGEKLSEYESGEKTIPKEK